MTDPRLQMLDKTRYKRIKLTREINELTLSIRNLQKKIRNITEIQRMNQYAYLDMKLNVLKHMRKQL